MVGAPGNFLLFCCHRTWLVRRWHQVQTGGGDVMAAIAQVLLNN
jgi:hypothetical protein